MTTTTAPALPARLALQPRDPLGYVVPFFAIGDDPDPWVVRIKAARVAHGGRLCFTCGQPLGAFAALTLTPASLITRAAPEPPSHRTCAEYAVTGWLSVNHPAMHRQGLPAFDPSDARTEPDVPVPGEGVVAIFATQEWNRQRGRDMYSFRAPFDVTWWREGRRATYPEALDGLVSGRELLRVQADEDPNPDRTRALLDAQYEKATGLLPGNKS